MKSLAPLLDTSFPRSCVGMHTPLSGQASVWVPTEKRGNQGPKLINVTFAGLPADRSEYSERRYHI